MPSDDFIIQSHRGAGVLAPENSLEGFERGWSLGCWPEADVRTTRDGVIVAYHDENFRHVRSIPEAMRGKSVADVTWAELSAFEHHGTRVPVLADVLARMTDRPERRLYLDVKDVDLDRLAELVRDARVESQVVLASTHHPPLRRWRELLLASQTLLWMGGDEPALRQRLLALRHADFAGITQLQVHVRRWPDPASPADERTILTPSEKFIGNLAKELHARGILFQALPYEGGGDPETYRRLLDLGVESFATDHPTVALAAMRAHARPITLDAALAAASDTRAIVIATGALVQVVPTFRAQFGDALLEVIADVNTAPVARRVLEEFRAAGVQVRDPFVFDEPHVPAENAVVERLETLFHRLGDDVVPVAVGSGTINDLVKLAAHRTGRPYMIVATAASMDGYTAFGASITHRGSKQTFDCPAPRAVIADLEVIGAAPTDLNASGYADLLAKLTAGADWILADELRVEPIDDRAWRTVQAPLRDWLVDPAGVRSGDANALRRLSEGLMMSGLAMQATRSSRPASGAEHQFSHLWDMQHHVDPRSGEPPSHGFKVGVATIAVAEIYERLLAMPLENFEVNRAVASWPSWQDEHDHIERLFPAGALRDKALEESRAKHIGRPALADQLTLLRDRWPSLRARLRAHLLPAAELRRLLATAGAPAEPEEIGITRARLRDSVRLAYHIRRRFTVLDLATRAGLMQTLLPGR